MSFQVLGNVVRESGKNSKERGAQEQSLAEQQLLDTVTCLQ